MSPYAALNPFTVTSVGENDLWNAETFLDVTYINSVQFGALKIAVDQVRAQRRSQVRFIRGAGGSGKSHLFSRLHRESADRIFYAYAPNPPLQPEALEQFILARLVGSLRHPVRSADGSEAPYSQLRLLAYALLKPVVEQELTLAQLHDSWTDIGLETRKEMIHQAVQILETEHPMVPRSVLRCLLNILREDKEQLSAQWLSGAAYLTENELKYLGVPEPLQRGDMGVVIQLFGKLAAQAGAPVVLVLDQLDLIVTQPQFDEMQRLLFTLIDQSENWTILIGLVAERFAMWDAALSQALRGRIGVPDTNAPLGFRLPVIDMLPIANEQKRLLLSCRLGTPELVALRKKEGITSAIYPLLEEDVTRLTAGGAIFPRHLLAAAAEIYTMRVIDPPKLQPKDVITVASSPASNGLKAPPVTAVTPASPPPVAVPTPATPPPVVATKPATPPAPAAPAQPVVAPPVAPVKPAVPVSEPPPAPAAVSLPPAIPAPAAPAQPVVAAPVVPAKPAVAVPAPAALSQPPAVPAQPVAAAKPVAPEPSPAALPEVPAPVVAAKPAAPAPVVAEPAAPVAAASPIAPPAPVAVAQPVPPPAAVAEPAAQPPPPVPAAVSALAAIISPPAVVTSQILSTKPEEETAPVPVRVVTASKEKEVLPAVAVPASPVAEVVPPPAPVVVETTEPAPVSVPVLTKQPLAEKIAALLVQAIDAAKADTGASSSIDLGERTRDLIGLMVAPTVTITDGDIRKTYENFDGSDRWFEWGGGKLRIVTTDSMRGSLIAVLERIKESGGDTLLLRHDFAPVSGQLTLELLNAFKAKNTFHHIPVSETAVLDALGRMLAAQREGSYDDLPTEPAATKENVLAVLRSHALVRGLRLWDMIQRTHAPKETHTPAPPPPSVLSAIVRPPSAAAVLPPAALVKPPPVPVAAVLPPAAIVKPPPVPGAAVSPPPMAKPPAFPGAKPPSFPTARPPSSPIVVAKPVARPPSPPVAKPPAGVPRPPSAKLPPPSQGNAA